MARTYLNCPFDEKDQAKALGARWDAAPGGVVWGARAFPGVPGIGGSSGEGGEDQRAEGDVEQAVDEGGHGWPRRLWFPRG